MVDVAVIGASGYGGGELLRWLSVHPAARVRVATSRTYAGRPVADSFAGLAGLLDLRFAPDASVADLSGCAVAFLARDNGWAMGAAEALLGAVPRLIDLSADFRFRDPAVYGQWYGDHAAPSLAAEAVYGLPELHRDAVRAARIVGNPGCYTTASILALAPLVARKLVDPATIVIDAKSGVSGAGRSKFGLDYHFAEANESVTPYRAAGTHRHTPEIEQELSALGMGEVRVSFTPHLIPMTRGILATCYATLATACDAQALREVYRSFYAGHPFVQIRDGLTSTKHVVGSNMCHIGLGVDARVGRVTVFSALDNLGKGMATQAIQNMNLMLGFEEATGLRVPGLWP
ncbi:MAG TPA: N-acetyl-gamma-glutamyl-phosphate reductase [Chthonomonadales bacterium]|nr:N-acetyl-gamma-glutamyl-phosphate reductase [Chthonomonadales bacterium]